MRSGHVEIVSENDAFEAETLPQHFLQPEGGEACRQRRLAGVGGRIDDVGRHHPGELMKQTMLVGGDVLLPQAGEIALIDRHFMMRVGAHEAVTGKMFANRCNAGSVHADHHRLRQTCDHLGFGIKGTAADRAAAVVIKVEHGRKAEGDAVGAQFGTEHQAGGTCFIERGKRIFCPTPSQTAHRRQAGEAVAAKALYAAAFVIDADDQWR